MLCEPNHLRPFSLTDLGENGPPWGGLGNVRATLTTTTLKFPGEAPPPQNLGGSTPQTPEWALGLRAQGPTLLSGGGASQVVGCGQPTPANILREHAVGHPMCRTHQMIQTVADRPQTVAFQLSCHLSICQ